MKRCLSCQRYVRESACPFCQSEEMSSLPPNRTPGGLSRAAVLAVAGVAAGAIAVSACSETITPVYGGPGVDASSDGSGDDVVSPVAEYGASPTDAGGDEDVVASGTKYGGPPM